MANTTHSIATDAANDTPPDSPEWLVGDHYDDTVDWPLGRIADVVQQDLYDVRYDNMLPAAAEFDVTPDTDGPVPVLRVTITGLVDTGSFDAMTAGVESAIYKAMLTAFGLANHYNLVHLARPERSRFIQYIAALRPDGTPAIVLVGMMHDAITPTPSARPATMPAIGVGPIGIGVAALPAPVTPRSVG